MRGRGGGRRWLRAVTRVSRGNFILKPPSVPLASLCRFLSLSLIRCDAPTKCFCFEVGRWTGLLLISSVCILNSCTRYRSIWLMRYRESCRADLISISHVIFSIGPWKIKSNPNWYRFNKLSHLLWKITLSFIKEKYRIQLLFFF